MLRFGKVSPLVVIGILGLMGLAGMLLFLQGSEGPGVRTHKFFNALAKADIDGIMKVSTFGDEPAESVRKKWETTLHRSEYFRFYWKVKETFQPSPEEAVVAVSIYVGVDRPDPTETKYQIPLSKINGEWFVDAKSLNREIFPALPR